MPASTSAFCTSNVPASVAGDVPPAIAPLTIRKGMPRATAFSSLVQTSSV
jgi:hypothetical protein